MKSKVKLEDILMCLHTEVFTNMKQADMRKILFGMASEKTDLDIAKELGNVSEVAELLENYTSEEITAMNKATMKKCDEQLKVIPGQIEGLELAKTDDIDTAELELLKNDISSQIEDKKAYVNRLEAEKEKVTSCLVAGMKLEFDKNSELERINSLATKEKSELGAKLTDIHNQLIEAKRTQTLTVQEIEFADKRIKQLKKDFAELKDNYDKQKAVTFNEHKKTCPTCGQDLPAEQIEAAIKRFETNKKSNLDSINLKGKEVSKTINELTKQSEKLMAKEADITKEVDSLNSQYKDMSDLYTNFVPKEITTTPELEEIEKKIAENEAQKSLLPGSDVDALIEAAKKDIEELLTKAEQLSREIGKASNNARIDEQIDELVDKRAELEQAKANAERVLYQLELLSKAKNEQLVNDINSNFKLVKWQLFSYLKNGNYKEDCKAFSLDGKELGVATNTALEVAMKVDICRGLQKFYGIELPIVVDNSECIDSENMSNFEADTQLIFLKVTDDKLLVVE